MNISTHYNPFEFTPIYLASQSPRRAQLLEQIGIPFEVVLPEDSHAAELLETVQLGEKPLQYVQRVTLMKLHSMQTQVMQLKLPARPILCADTTVAFGEEILGKPLDAADAKRMLRLLSAQTHQVHTAVAILSEGQIHTACVTSEVSFKEIKEQEIQAYIDSGEPFGRAGSYAVQGFAAAFISHLSGSYSAVMGLPVFEVAQLLREAQK
ncbi:Maf family protein [Hydromonas duriensis]|uniref:dTTP/UTP pyrophosphatase n=1 Tax=Hydromonas duriensis TaxID=1527608 RepID=A0A4R6Y8J8_9BURK|nr:Maf family protein [Hydromonas duriensis]TDR31701.1 septum formation protein [Hydromonas duriensis]